MFGRVGMWFDYACSNWPVTSTEKQPDFTAKGAAPILVVGTTRDPATPYQQAVKLADELDSGVLLSRDGDGHTAYGTGNSCIDDAINHYLLTGDAAGGRDDLLTAFGATHNGLHEQRRGRPRAGAPAGRP